MVALLRSKYLVADLLTLGCTDKHTERDMARAIAVGVDHVIV
jgi:hypothetical protein